MATKQDLTPEWLQEKLVLLLNHASAIEAPDHSACAKYLEIAFKLLPKGEVVHKERQIALDEIRRAVMEAKP